MSVYSTGPVYESMVYLLWLHPDKQSRDELGKRWKGKPWTHKQRNTMNADGSPLGTRGLILKASHEVIFWDDAVPFLRTFDNQWKRFYVSISARLFYTHITCETQGWKELRWSHILSSDFFDRWFLFLYRLGELPGRFPKTIGWSGWGAWVSSCSRSHHPQPYDRAGHWPRPISLSPGTPLLTHAPLQLTSSSLFFFFFPCVCSLNGLCMIDHYSKNITCDKNYKIYFTGTA